MNRRALAQTALLVVLGALAAACGPNGSDGGADASERLDAGRDTDAEGAVAPLEIGVLDDTGAFDPIEEGEEVEITVGFQGLIFIDFAIAGPNGMPRRVSGTARVEFEGRDGDFTREKTRLRFDGQVGDRRLLEQFRIPFSDLSVVRDADIRLVVELESGNWSGRDEVSFHAVYTGDTTEPPPDADAGLDASDP